MGSLCSKDVQVFAEFTRSIREEAKRKSMYQYQIAHFKMLNIEKKQLPSYQSVAETKMMNFKNVKRLEDIKRIFSRISSKDEDLKDVRRLKEIEKSIQAGLKELKVDVDSLLKEETMFSEHKKKLNRLLNLKSILQHRKQDLNTMSQRADLTRRNSMKLLENAIQEKLHTHDKEMTRKNVNNRLINCIRRIEKIERIVLNTKNCKLYEQHTQISQLESKIFFLKKQKDEIITLKNLDEIEKTFENSISQIAEEVNLIKLEYEKVIKLNDLLSTELTNTRV